MRAVLVRDNSPGVTVFGGIKGLKRDGDRLEETFNEIQPDVILATISPEEAEGIVNFVKEPYAMTLSDYEMIYGVNLRNYGEVETPAPIFTESARWSIHGGVPLIGLDMTEEKFSREYTQNVSTRDLLRHSVRKRGLFKAKFSEPTAEEFVTKWDAMVNSIRGLRKMEELRIKEIESNLDLIISQGMYHNILVVSEFEFYPRIVEFLKHLGYGEKSE